MKEEKRRLDRRERRLDRREEELRVDQAEEILIGNPNRNPNRNINRNPNRNLTQEDLALEEVDQEETEETTGNSSNSFKIIESLSLRGFFIYHS